jgi:hypothetical protein
LAYGEVTGYSHRIAELDSAKMWQVEETLFMGVVAATARLVYEEHAPMELPQGIYRIWRQREYTPPAIVRLCIRQEIRDGVFETQRLCMAIYRRLILRENVFGPISGKRLI